MICPALMWPGRRCWIPDKEHPKPVEVELTQKSEWRYKELWESFTKRYPYGSQVLYLVGWPDGVEALLKLTEKLEGSGAYLIHVASLKAFRESLGRCPFVNKTYYFPREVRLAPALAARPVPNQAAVAGAPEGVAAA